MTNKNCIICESKSASNKAIQEYTETLKEDYRLI